MSQPTDTACNAKNAVAFVVIYKAHALPIAQQLNVPVEYVLGLAAEESQWGKGHIAVAYNNYFSMHAPAKFQTSAVPAKGNPNVKVAVFKSFGDSAASFVDRFGDGVRGAASPADFAKGLVAVKFNSGNSKNGGRDDFVPYLVDLIEKTKKRMNCPG